MLFVPPSMPFMVPEAEAETVGNSIWSLRFCAFGVSGCSTVMTVGDVDEIYVPLTRGYTFEYPGTGSGTISIINNVGGGCTGTVQVSVIDIPTGIQARLSTSPAGADWHSGQTPETPYGACGGGNFLHLKIADDAPLGIFGMSIQAEGESSGHTIQITGVVEAATTPPPTTLAVTAYLNSTSPTGRTLSASDSDVDSFVEYYGNVAFGVNATKDNIYVGFVSETLLSPPIDPNASGGSWYFYTWQCGNNCQIPIPEDWEAGTYDLNWQMWYDGGSTAGSSTVVVPALSTPPTTLAVTAYLNSTSPTGRTLSVSDSDVDLFAEYYGGASFVINAFKDSAAVAFHDDAIPFVHYVTWSFGADSGGYICGMYWLSITTNCQIPIPEHWEAGTYDLNWGVNSGATTGSSTVTVPALPTPPTTLAITAYLNATSPTGRTLSVSDSDVDSFIEYYGVGQNLPAFGITAFKDEDYAQDTIYGPNTVAFHDDDNIGNFVFSHYTTWWFYTEQCGPSDEPNYTWDDSPNCQIPLPEHWEAGTYDLNWEMYHVGGTITGSSTVAVPALPGAPTTLAVTAYLNSTSPTGRTISVSDSDIDSFMEYYDSTDFGITASKDGISLGWDLDDFALTWRFYPEQCGPSDEPNYTWDDSSNCQLPIPEHWEAGTYDLNWVMGYVRDNSYDVVAGTTTVTVPALPGAPTTLAVTAYLNSTSPTGRTLSVSDSDLDSFKEYYGGTNFWIHAFKDSAAVAFHDDDNIGNFVFSHYTTWWFGTVDPSATHLSLNNQIPLPEHWEAGTYDLNWEMDNGIVTGTGSTTVTVPALQTAAEAAEIVIPNWIKNNAGWWADGQIDDRAFVSGLQWLISNGIMNIPPTEQGAGSDDVIPGWIKNNAGWWADDLIDDRNFVTGLQWLITNGIMIIG